ncbi:MAG: shikimate kinase [Desulfuromonadales bacterium]
MPSPSPSNCFLTGFMGAGKTVTGQELARRLGFAFVDLDQEIIARENRSIATIFAAEGEAYFRQCENRLLSECRSDTRIVYATGGGIVMNANNRRLMRRNGRIVYLQTSWPVLRQRLQTSIDRPLIGPERDWAAIEELWRRRQLCYADADLVVTTDGLTPGQVAQQIARWFNTETSP